ncbi:MAG TPA: PEP/pyruvate-binding domain-containing protein [Planctomycetota bacterium]|nr:PEP/pyruvate-binding domain-containing protein [Planctomycetota bacterium]
MSVFVRGTGVRTMALNRILLWALPCIISARSADGQAGPDYLGLIEKPEDFEAVSASNETGGDVERYTKYLIPATDDPTLLPPAFQNMSRYDFHWVFLKEVFPDRFPAFDFDQYKSLVARRATRKYYAGLVSRYRTSEGGLLYGFTVFADADELLTAEETRSVHDRLRTAFTLEPFAYAPDTPITLDAARGWQNPGFPVYLGGVTDSVFVPYTRGVGYGRVRLLTEAAFNEGNAKGLFGSEDILVLERAPSDIEGVVAGVVTAEPQGVLSHLSIRTARRGTPNAYVKDALSLLAPFSGKLVRLEVSLTEYTALEAPLAEAEAWWTEHRPRLSAPPVVDAEYSRLDSLAEMDLSDAVVPAEARFGGKAVNFARLQRILTGPFERYGEGGFGIPMHYYLEFMRSNRTRSALDPGRQVTYEQYILELLDVPDFKGDPTVRFELLERFRETIEDDGVVGDALVESLIERIGDVFGSTSAVVRFRSSSNVEDALEFNGAGLYDSTSACAEDDLDGDDAGPSRCDPTQPRERRIARALKLVWASLWNFRAFEERAYYQIPQDRVAMGVLVSIAFLDEAANGVAFTGNPSNSRDRRHVVTAQVGEESVVSPEPGRVAEKNLLEVEDGVVTRIERSVRSSLVPPGTYVLSDETLREMGALLWHIERTLPVDLGPHDRSEVLFDTEFKVEANGDLSLKQVRPFLVEDSGPAGPTFELEVPPGTTVCSVWVDGRDPRGAYAVKSQVRLVAGTHSLPTDAPFFSGMLFEEVLFGPGREGASPAAPGRFRLTTTIGGDGLVEYSFRYGETFLLPGGEELSLEVNSLDFETRRGEPLVASKVLDEEFVTGSLDMLGVPGGDRVRRLVRYSSCSYESIPLWQGRVDIEGDSHIRFEERYVVQSLGSSPASLVGAEITLGGVAQEIRDYWRLVYAAEHHNERVRYWFVLDPPITVAGVGQVGVVEVHEPQRDRRLPAQALYLSPGFDVLERPRVLCYQKAPAGELGSCAFRRGDTDTNGDVNLTDAVFLLRHLFQGGGPLPCEDAGDFNDDDFVEITDAVLILLFLFQGVDLSEPPGPFECGLDPTFDLLSDCDDSACST